MAAMMEDLRRFKANVKESHQYFEPDYTYYHKMMKFIFETTLSQDDITLLQTLKKPVLEFNILEAYVSRQLGEFSSSEPSLAVGSMDGKRANPELINIVEGHTRFIMFESNRDNTLYNVMRDVLGGGFSVIELYTDYTGEKSFEQEVFFKRVFDPTLCGFDKLAQESHKGDGR